jgi:CDP-paratose 2-epimerase
MKTIILGGAGFVGSNAACRLLQRGQDVVIIDNLSRVGSEKNVEWLRQKGSFEFVPLDIRNAADLRHAFSENRDADCVLHLAAQVAVTTSVIAPREDFEINAIGTFNVLETMRELRMPATLLYASTNKVYGDMADVATVEEADRYCCRSLPFGVPEERTLDFHSPYGCSKGSADQYVIDYHRIYGLRTVVFRQSCIYGYRQFGAEDQGWVAWFMIASQLGRPITIYGDGKQVRDILFIDDLLDAYEAALTAGSRAFGRAYNIGGGPANVVSLRDLLAYIGKQEGRHVSCRHMDWRPGDQKVFVSDIRRAKTELDWAPRVSSAEGLDLVYRWVAENKDLFEQVSAAVA